MTFWNQAVLEPKRNFRFKIEKSGWGDQAIWWWANSVDKPSFNVTNNEYQLINHKFKYPGVVSWNNIQMTLADIGSGGPNSIVVLEKELSKIGYKRPDKEAMKGVSKSDSMVSNLIIEQIDADGKTIDKFTLIGAFITSVSYSSLSYSSDDISEVTLEIAYDYANYEN